MSASLEKGLAVLTTLAEHAHNGGRPLALREVAAASGLDKATAYRLLRSLRKFALVVQDEEGRYGLGTGALALAQAAFRSHRLVGRMIPAMRALADATNETINLAELHETTSVTVHEIPSTQQIRYTTRIGNATPLHLGASSRVVLAFAAPAVVDAVLSGPRSAATPQSVVEREALEALCAQTRRDRYAVSCGERVPGTYALAVPLLAADDYAIGSLAILWPARGAEIDAERVRAWPALLHAAIAELQGTF
jgi:DNA-binding IclR family transcriptional regulator